MSNQLVDVHLTRNGRTITKYSTSADPGAVGTEAPALFEQATKRAGVSGNGYSIQVRLRKTGEHLFSYPA